MLGMCSRLSQIHPKKICPDLMNCVWDITNSVREGSMLIYLPTGSRELRAIPCPCFPIAKKWVSIVGKSTIIMTKPMSYQWADERLLPAKLLKLSELIFSLHPCPCCSALLASPPTATTHNCRTCSCMTSTYPRCPDLIRRIIIKKTP